MARSLRGSFPGRATSQRRKTAWGIGPGGQTAAAIAAGAPQFIGSAIQPGVEGLTIVRLRGHLDIQLTLATAANDGFSGSIGIGLATLAAVTAGIASVPTPLTEQDAENWLWWYAFNVHGAQAFSTGAAPGTEQNGTVVSVEIDSKAMRKFPSEMSIYAAVESAETGTAAMIVRLDTRMLLKLP